METYDNWIDGGFAPPPSGRRMATANPFTGEPWAEVADDPDAVDDAVRAARRAFTDGPGPPWPVPSGPSRCAASESC